MLVVSEPQKCSLGGRQTDVVRCSVDDAKAKSEQNNNDRLLRRSEEMANERQVKRLKMGWRASDSEGSVLQGLLSGGEAASCGCQEQLGRLDEQGSPPIFTRQLWFAQSSYELVIYGAGYDQMLVLRIYAAVRLCTGTVREKCLQSAQGGL